MRAPAIVLLLAIATGAPAAAEPSIVVPQKETLNVPTPRGVNRDDFEIQSQRTFSWTRQCVRAEVEIVHAQGFYSPAVVMRESASRCFEPFVGGLRKIGAEGIAESAFRIMVYQELGMVPSVDR